MTEAEYKQDIRKKVREIIKPYCDKYEISYSESMIIGSKEVGDRLINGVIDSIETVKIIMQLEETFNIQFPDGAYSSPEDLIRIICDKRDIPHNTPQRTNTATTTKPKFKFSNFIRRVLSQINGGNTGR